MSEWVRRHEASETAALCRCGDPVQRRTDRESGRTVVLRSHPSEDGTWQIDTRLRAYRTMVPVHAYAEHRCEGDE